MMQSLLGISRQDCSNHAFGIEVGMETAEATSVLLVHLDMLNVRIEVIWVSKDKCSKMEH